MSLTYQIVFSGDFNLIEMSGACKVSDLEIYYKDKERRPGPCLVDLSATDITINLLEFESFLAYVVDSKVNHESSDKVAIVLPKKLDGPILNMAQTARTATMKNTFKVFFKRPLAEQWLIS